MIKSDVKFFSNEKASHKLTDINVKPLLLNKRGSFPTTYTLKR